MGRLRGLPVCCTCLPDTGFTALYQRLVEGLSTSYTPAYGFAEVLDAVEWCDTVGEASEVF